MRDYRKRKRAKHVGGSVSQVSSPPNPRVMRESAGTSFRTALELARPFPLGFLASEVCLYCYNTGYSSPGTRCSYCQSGER